MSAAHRGSHPGGAAAPTQQQKQQQQQPAFTASEVFRGTSLGDALETALFELEDARQFPDCVHDFAMRAFDQSITMRLSEFATTAATIDGGKHSHQDCEGIWFWEIKNAVFTNLHNGRTITAPELKVTAVEAKGSMPQAAAGR